MKILPYAPLLLLLAACDSRGAAPIPNGAAALADRLQPAPTEHLQDDDAERRHKRERKRWIEEMHVAPPDVDWREIERANGRREMERRNSLAAGGELPMSGSRWSEVGSRNLAGRMHCARLGPDGPAGRKLYAGSALGGLWRGDPDGTDWEPLGDNLFGGVHELLVRPGDLPGDPDVVLAATDGGDVHVSRDLGATWQVPAGLPNFGSLRGVGQAVDANGTWYLLGRHGGSLSLYASVDTGHSFTQRWSTSGWDGSLWVPQAGGATATHVYVLDQGRLRFSSDGGSSFIQLSTVHTTSTEGILTASEAGGPHFYAALKVSGQWKLYRSTDGGGSFSYRHDIDDFWESLCASTVNPNIVIYAGVEAWRSIDGGGSFNKINGWGEYYNNPAGKLHADLPGVYCWPDPDAPATDDIWYFCTDGGLYESTDSAATVANISLSGLGVSQYYSTLSSSANPDRIAAGSQDQGYQRGVLEPPSGPGPSTDFNQLISGDYGHLTSGDGSHAFVYSTYPGFILVHSGEWNPTLYTIDFPSGSNQLWLPPVVADPTDIESFYFLGRYLYRYTKNVGPGWSYVQHSSKSFTDGGGSYLSALAVAPSNHQRYYAVNNSGRLYRSTDGGVNWTMSSDGGPSSHYFYGNALAVHPLNEMQAFVGGSGYSGGGVRRTTDGGQNWTLASDGLPSTLVYDLAFAGDTSGDVFAATEAGAFRWTQATGSWENIMVNEAPLTLYWSVEAVHSRQVMRFGTYGRGIWDYDYDTCVSPSTYCVTSPNSAGAGATISSMGKPRLSEDDFHLLASDLPHSQFLMFYYGAGQTQITFGNGYRCVHAGGVGLFRFMPIKADITGFVVQKVELTQPPAGSGGGLGQWLVGDTWYAQGWYRDPAAGGAMFNLTDGIEIFVCP